MRRETSVTRAISSTEGVSGSERERMLVEGEHGSALRSAARADLRCVCHAVETPGSRETHRIELSRLGLARSGAGKPLLHPVEETAPALGRTFVLSG